MKLVVFEVEPHEAPAFKELEAAAYERYMSQTPAFIPGLGATSGDRKRGKA